MRSTPTHTAYLKIAEGCSNRCTFCFIPKLRGPYRSRSVSDVAKEATRMAAEGVCEINVIAQDITAFGTDHGETGELERLLEALEAIPGIDWIRLLYAYPGRITTSLLRTMAQSEKTVPYLDFPIQHCVPHILNSMHRGTQQCDMEALIDQIRTQVPGIALRTSIMVGFPGETEQDFEALLRFVERMQFEHLGVFAYSPEAGTAAARFPRQVPDEVKWVRHERLLDLQRRISRQRIERLCGSVVPVLVEGYHPETDLLLCGRMPTQAPEVDGMVLISKGVGRPGAIMPVMITSTDDYDLIGELIEAAPGAPSSA
jgi:ribosomal protein S12 methylthiotransferase